MHTRLLSVILFGFLLSACKGNTSGESHGPIVLGDSSTIVTETNVALLQDQVPDLKPAESAGEEQAAATANDSTQKPAAPAPASAPAPAMGGLVAAFKEVTINIPGISARTYGKADLQNARSASYELTGGNLPGAQLRISSGQVTKVSQRYQAMLMLKDGSDKLVLESLPKQTSDWETLTGTGGAYSIAGLAAGDLEYKLPSAAALRNAVQQAARKARLNRADTQDWLNALRNLRAANQAPAAIFLRSVMWRMEGKGFSKEVRVDVPLP